MEIDNRIKLSIGFFSILALLVLGYSGMNLLQLYDTPLFGVSSESKLAKRKWDRLKVLTSEKGKVEWSRSIDLLIKSSPRPVQKVENTNYTQEKEQIARYKDKPLQKITGIIITTDFTGEQNASVIIEGKRYSVNDEVSGYMIDKVTKDGVSLVKNERHYFLAAPAVPFSVDQGE